MKLLLVGLLTLASLKSEPNPGFLDDPGCKALIVNQLRDIKENIQNYTVTYYATDSFPGKDGLPTTYANYYHLTQKSTGRKFMAMITMTLGPVPEASPLPSPSPSPATLTVHI